MKFQRHGVIHSLSSEVEYFQIILRLFTVRLNGLIITIKLNNVLYPGLEALQILVVEDLIGRIAWMALTF